MIQSCDFFVFTCHLNYFLSVILVHFHLDHLLVLELAIVPNMINSKLGEERGTFSSKAGRGVDLCLLVITVSSKRTNGEGCDIMVHEHLQHHHHHSALHSHGSSLSIQ